MPDQTNYQTQNISSITKPSPTSTSDEITNWKTYTDEKNKFSFRYPEVWYFKQYKITYPDPHESVRFFRTGDKELYSMMMAKGNEQLIVALHNNLNWNELQKDLSSESNTIIVGLRALKYATGTYILLSEKRETILNIYRPVYPDEKNYLDQILSTFQLTAQ